MGVTAARYSGYSALSISNTLYLEAAPRTNFTFDGATPKYLANSFAATTFARPSIAGALAYTVSEPSSFTTTSSRWRELGLRWTEIFMVNILPALSYYLSFSPIIPPYDKLCVLYYPMMQ